MCTERRGRKSEDITLMGSFLSSLVFQPPDITYKMSKKIIWLKSKDGIDIPALHLDKKYSTTILFSHGNAEDLGMVYEWIVTLSYELRVNILAYDYTGYGKAKGSPNEDSCYRNIEAAYSYLTEKCLIAPESIVFFGRSLGTGPSTYLAHKLSEQGVRIGGLVLQSPLLSVYRVAFNFRFTMSGDMFPNIDRIVEVACPVFVIHGVRDEIVPFWNGEELFLNIPVYWRAEPFWIRNSGHNNIESSASEELFRRFREFLSIWIMNYLPPTHIAEYNIIKR